MRGLQNCSSFTNHGIKFLVCNQCGHINGSHEETHEFTEGIYEKSNYADMYASETIEKYKDRVDRIYTPKVKFLLDVLQQEKQEEQVEPIQQQQTTGEKQEQLQELKKLKNFSFLDVGAGSGYFVSALLKEGLKASGIEISSEQVKFGNQMISEAFQNQFITPCKVQEAMHQVAEDGIADYIRNSKADVLSFIGVIEHMLNPHEALQAMLDNKN